MPGPVVLVHLLTTALFGMALAGQRWAVWVLFLGWAAGAAWAYGQNRRSGR